MSWGDDTLHSVAGAVQGKVEKCECPQYQELSAPWQRHPVPALDRGSRVCGKSLTRVIGHGDTGRDAPKHGDEKNTEQMCYVNSTIHF